MGVFTWRAVISMTEDELEEIGLCMDYASACRHALEGKVVSRIQIQIFELKPPGRCFPFRCVAVRKTPFFESIVEIGRAHV